MIGQSLAIIIVILVMAFMFLRSGRRAGALFALPLISVSAAHLLGAAVYNLLAQSGFSAAGLHVAIDVAGMLAGLALCWIMARAMPSQRLRWAYFGSCAVFLGLLTVAYIRNLT